MKFKLETMAGVNHFALLGLAVGIIGAANGSRDLVSAGLFVAVFSLILKNGWADQRLKMP